MTREEAIAKVRFVPSSAHSIPLPTADVLVDRLAALGLLKLEEPKTDEECIIDNLGMLFTNLIVTLATGKFGVLDGASARFLAEMVVKCSGFKIVRET